MLKVAKLFQEHEQSLNLSSKKVNADDSTDKSLSGTSVQPITQLKAPTDLKTKKKRIPPSSKPKSSNKVRVILLKKQVAETQNAEETKATADATQSLGASKSAEDQLTNLGDSDSDSGLHSMPDNDLVSLTGFETLDSTSQEGTVETLNASADMPAQSDPLVSEALKTTLPQMLKVSIKQSVSESIKEKLSLFDAQNKPPVNEENDLVLHALVEKSSEVNNSKKKVTDDEPPPDATQMTIEQLTEHLNKTTSSIFSPTLPIEPTSPRIPTPPRDKSKGKSIATEEPLKDFMPFMEEGGSTPKILSFKSFVIPEGKLTNEDVITQVKEMKRLANLKAEKEKSL
ncbi:hypothetical protein Tco_1401149 [Tanacetum coccineum]